MTLASRLHNHAALLAPALLLVAGCSAASPVEAPLSPEALAAVTDKPGAP
ncbi:MAG: serine hydrolase, partial [Erythrobacter sp.]|nr:serine hydrolase [Erythrobacter sp.]